MCQLHLDQQRSQVQRDENQISRLYVSYGCPNST